MMWEGQGWILLLLKKGMFFLTPLALSVPIINKIYHRTKAGERLKAVPKLCEPRSAYYIDFTAEWIAS